MSEKTGTAVQLDRIESWISKHDTDEREQWEVSNQRWVEIEKHIVKSKAADEKIANLQDAVHGNGKDGLKVDVDRLKESSRRMSKFLWGIGGATIVIVAKQVFPVLIALL